MQLIETKKTGRMRFCDHCQKLKPDRAHHCRLCDICILKMDHHCPWIANCVGFWNYKYFMLTLHYSVIATTLIICSYFEAVLVWMNNKKVEYLLVFAIVIFYSLCICLWIIVVCFFIFHCYLIFNAMTTIEFCEKRR